MLVQLLEVVLLVAILSLDEVDGAAELGIDPAHLRFVSGSGSCSKKPQINTGSKSPFSRDEKSSNVAKFRISRGFFSSASPPPTKRPKLFRREIVPGRFYSRNGHVFFLFK